MSDPMLGRLLAVPARDVWLHEAHNFTPWLLQNADALSQVLGMDLDLERAEHPVGGFSLDLIGKDRATGELVIIENQLEISDHSHLGQILTYAGGSDPTNVVWLATSFREEHRAAMEWLNERTDERTRFFAVAIRVVRIGESIPAPFFEVVVRPNDWGKQVRAATQSGHSRTEEDFYEALDRGGYGYTAAAARQLYAYNRDVAPGSSIYWGAGKFPSMTAQMPVRGVTLQPWSIYTATGAEPSFALNFEYVYKDGTGVADTTMTRFASALRLISDLAPAVESARLASWRKRPGLPSERFFRDPTTLEQLKSALGMLVDESGPDPDSPGGAAGDEAIHT